MRKYFASVEWRNLLLEETHLWQNQARGGQPSAKTSWGELKKKKKRAQRDKQHQHPSEKQVGLLRPYGSKYPFLATPKLAGTNWFATPSPVQTPAQMKAFGTKSGRRRICLWLGRPAHLIRSERLLASQIATMEVTNLKLAWHLEPLKTHKWEMCHSEINSPLNPKPLALFRNQADGRVAINFARGVTTYFSKTTNLSCDCIAVKYTVCSSS